MAVTQKPTVVAGNKKPKSAPSHPPYHVMIQEAIVALKERTGSSQIAIAKHIESNHASHLPENFKKFLLIQLKKLVANGKLVKVKNSFKLAHNSSKAAVEKKLKAVIADAKPKKKVSKEDAVKPEKKEKETAKGKKGPAVKPKKVKSIKSPVKKPKSIKSPVKKAKSIKSPVKKPKSIKSPVKKAKSIKSPVKKPKSTKSTAKK